MNKCDIEYLREWFRDYVESFNVEDDYTRQNIEIKKVHTASVCQNILGICNSLNLEEEKCFIAEAAGLFHDVGRFEQLEKYRTFNDSTSENHAEMGIRVVERKKVFSRLPERECEMIIKAIRCHNRLEIPNNEDSETLLYIKMVRDADKLDILEILTTYYFSKENGSNPALDIDLPVDSSYSEAVMQDIFNNRPVNIQNAVTATDFKLLQIGWLFDINFEYTMNRIREKQYMEKRLDLLPPGENTQRIRQHVLSYLMKRQN